MLAEEEVVLYSDDIVLVVGVVKVQVLQDPEFDACLILELLFVSYYFDCNFFFCFVVQALYCLSKTTLS